MVPSLLRWYTFLDRARIEELEQITLEHPERREGQRALAREVTTLVHGAAETERAERAAEVLFSPEIAELEEATLLGVFADAPSSSRPRSDLDGQGLAVVEALRDSQLAKSLGEARTNVSQGGVYVNNHRVDDPEARLSSADLLHDRYVILRRGKRDHHLIRFG